MCIIYLGELKMKVTKKYIEKVIKEELKRVLNEGRLGGYEFRITNGQGTVPGLKPGTDGKTIMVQSRPNGRGPTPQHKQIYVLPKAAYEYRDLEEAFDDSITGEAYYMTDEEIEQATRTTSALPGTADRRFYR